MTARDPREESLAIEAELRVNSRGDDLVRESREAFGATESEIVVSVSAEELLAKAISIVSGEMSQSATPTLEVLRRLIDPHARAQFAALDAGLLTRLTAAVSAGEDVMTIVDGYGIPALAPYDETNDEGWQPDNALGSRVRHSEELIRDVIRGAVGMAVELDPRRADDRRWLLETEESLLAPREVTVARLTDDFDEMARRLAAEHDVPLEHVEADLASAIDRALTPHAPELVASLGDLGFSDDPEIAVRALELAGRFSSHLQQLGDHDHQEP
jgi:hypothetical protein